jgi:hypothetical protein
MFATAWAGDPLGNSEPNRVLVQSLLLAFCRSNLDQLSDFVDKLQGYYSQHREIVTDPRRTLVTKQSLQEVVMDAYFYDELQECVSNLTFATLSLLELLSIKHKAQPSLDFDYVATETRAVCSDLTKSSTRLSARLDSHLRLFQLLRSFNESQSVRVLGLLASIFLPLSLASGLLSMQTRLADLHFILYDFFGVLVLLGTIVLAIIVMLNIYVRLHEQLLKSKNDPIIRRWIYPFVRVGVLGSSLIVWGLLVSSFLVGMITNVELGLKILGYGAAVIWGLVVLAVMGASIMWKLL